MFSRGSIVLVLGEPADVAFGGCLGVVESVTAGGVGVWFRQRGAPPAEYALFEPGRLVAVGAMPGAGPPPDAPAGPLEHLREFVGRLRAEAVARANTFQGSGSEGPMWAGYRHACEEILAEILAEGSQLSAISYQPEKKDPPPAASFPADS